MRLHEGFEDWQTLERSVQQIGGENFGWQYMQGLYQPQTQGERPLRIDEDGMQWITIGNFDPTFVALDDVRRWRAEFLDINWT